MLNIQSQFRVWTLGIVSLITLGGLAAALCVLPQKRLGEDEISKMRSRLIVGEGITYKNLTIFPVSSKIARNSDVFITLDEGLKSGKVEVLEGKAVGGQNGEQQAPSDSAQTQQRQEAVQQTVQPPEVQQQRNSNINNLPQRIGQGGGNDVNRLFIINNSVKPLYLMPGEIVFGGDQDRVVAEEYIIQPSEKPSPIAVFCVEQGRWGGRSIEQTIAQLQAAGGETTAGSSQQQLQEKAEQANSGKFIGSFGNATNAVRKGALLDKNQSRVWENVQKENSRSGVTSQSSNFNQNYSDKRNLKRIAAYTESIERKIVESKNIVGVIVSINGKPQSMDVFNSTPLFKKLWPKMIKSFSLEAANSTENSKIKADTCSLEDATNFLNESFSGKASQDKSKFGLHMNKRESERVVLLSAEILPSDASVDANEIEWSVHSSAFAK